MRLLSDYWTDVTWLIKLNIYSYSLLDFLCIIHHYSLIINNLFCFFLRIFVFLHACTFHTFEFEYYIQPGHLTQHSFETIVFKRYLHALHHMNLPVTFFVY